MSSKLSWSSLWDAAPIPFLLQIVISNWNGKGIAFPIPLRKFWVQYSIEKLLNEWIMRTRRDGWMDSHGVRSRKHCFRNPIFQEFSFVFYIYLLLCGGGRRQAAGNGPPLPSEGFLGLNSNHQAWQQVSLPNKPAHHSPRAYFFFLHLSCSIWCFSTEFVTTIWGLCSLRWSLLTFLNS